MVIQIIFSVTFALSCTMFELIIFEIIGILVPRYMCIACGNVAGSYAYTYMHCTCTMSDLATYNGVHGIIPYPKTSSTVKMLDFR